MEVSRNFQSLTPYLLLKNLHSRGDLCGTATELSVSLRTELIFVSDSSEPRLYWTSAFCEK